MILGIGPRVLLLALRILLLQLAVGATLRVLLEAASVATLRVLLVVVLESTIRIKAKAPLPFRSPVAAPISVALGPSPVTVLRAPCGGGTPQAIVQVVTAWCTFPKLSAMVS